MTTMILSRWAPATPNHHPVPWGHGEHSLLRTFALSFLFGMLLLQMFPWLCPLFLSEVWPNVTVSEIPSLLTLYTVVYAPTKIRFYRLHCFILVHIIYLNSYLSALPCKLHEDFALFASLSPTSRTLPITQVLEDICWLIEWMKEGRKGGQKEEFSSCKIVALSLWISEWSHCLICG